MLLVCTGASAGSLLSAPALLLLWAAAAVGVNTHSPTATTTPSTHATLGPFCQEGTLVWDERKETWDLAQQACRAHARAHQACRVRTFHHTCPTLQPLYTGTTLATTQALCNTSLSLSHPSSSPALHAPPLLHPSQPPQTYPTPLHAIHCTHACLPATPHWDSSG